MGDIEAGRGKRGRESGRDQACYGGISASWASSVHLAISWLMKSGNGRPAVSTSAPWAAKKLTVLGWARTASSSVRSFFRTGAGTFAGRDRPNQLVAS